MESIPLKPNIPTVIFEKFDQEVVAINLTEGTYYSIEQTGYPVWILVETGATLTRIVEAFQDFFPDTPPDLPKIVKNFVQQLKDEGLIIPAKTNPRGEGSEKLDHLIPDYQRKFQPPVLRKFTDQRELLLLDPIHEVGDTGWPEQTDRPAGSDE